MARRGMKTEQLLLYGAGGVALASILSFAFKWPREVWGEPEGQIQLSVQPSEVNEGSGFPVTAQGTYMRNGQPANGTIYLKLRHPSGLYETLNQRLGPQFTETISTSGRAPGDYVVEASDNLQFI